MDMSKYVKMYVSESQERLQRMDGLLLALEQNGGDRAAIDTLFREAHSIKGMSASMSYDELSKVAHRMEDYLDQFRGGKGALQRRGVDLLFEGVDLLRRGVEEVAGGQHPSLSAEEYVAKMATVLLAPAAAPTDVAPPQGNLVVPPPRPAAPAGERSRFAVDLQIAADAPLPSARAYITLRRIRDLGELVRSVPTMEQVQAGQFTGGLSMLVATQRTAAEVQAFLGSLPDVASVVVRPAEGDAPSPPPAAPVAEQPAVERPRLEPARIAPPFSPPPPQAAPPTAVAAPPAPAPPPAASGGEPAGGGRRTITMTRVDTHLLDDLMDQVGELVTANGVLAEEAALIESPRLRETAGRLLGLIRGLQQQAMKLRMMPLETIVDRFPRAVRDLARKRGKEVSFEVQGKDTELDRAILEELPDPILHILRNAIDHGIEPAEERVRKGKPPVGTIRLEASKERESVVLRLSDDGRGIDPAVIRRVALERGVITREQAESMPDGDLIMLVTLPGFSTAKEVSDVSGRGVGMDVVRSTIETLRGTLLIESTIDQGTTFTLKLPLTLVVVAVLLIEAAGERYGLPVSVVEEILEIDRAEIQHAQGQEVIARDGLLLPLVRLRQLLNRPASEAEEARLVVVAEMRTRLIGLVVDRFIGYREVVVKPLDRALRGVRGFAGVTMLGDGSTVLVLDLNTL
jgi:two-component system, chemotaxis family, sensor kinase CheA